MLPDTPIEQLPSVTTVVRREPTYFIRSMWQGIKNLLALVGLLTILLSIFLYYKGYHAIEQLDPQFTDAFGKFLEQIVENDVANAMIVKMPLDEGISINQAIESMKLRANLMNVKLLGSYPLSKTIQKTIGTKINFIEIFEFCDMITAAPILQDSPAFAAQIPCRIAIYEDSNGQVWFVTTNLDIFIYGSRYTSAKLKAQLLKIQDNLLKIMGAGATGAL